MTDPRDPRTHPDELCAEDRRLIETLRTQLDPGERTPAQRAAFRARLEERIEQRAAPVWRPLLLSAGVAVAALALWFAVPGGLTGSDGSAELPVVGTTPGLLAYAYYETDYVGATDADGSFLSDEYEALALAFDLP